MKQIIKELLKRGDFVQCIAEETGKELVRQQTEDPWFPEDWSGEFFKTLQETVKKQVQEEVNIYMSQYDIKHLIDTATRDYISKSISSILERKE